MCVRIKERLLFALPVNVYEKRSEVAQQRLCRKLMVDEYFISTIGGKLAANDYFISFAAIYLNACGSEHLFEFRILRDQEKPFDKGASLTRLEQVRCKPPANQHAERVNDDGLA